jgi:cathepsin D
MFGPAAHVKAVYEAASARALKKKNGFFTFSCNYPPAIVLDWRGEDWEISPENISLGETERVRRLGCIFTPCVCPVTSLVE